MTDINQAIELLLERAKQLNVQLSSEQLSQIRQYCECLAEYNAHTNLVSDASPNVLVSDHIVDSLTLVKFIDEFKKRKCKQPGSIRIIDIGSGAGLPGMILAIALPDDQVTLVDSIAKKVKFLQDFIHKAGFGKRVTAIADRAEELAHQKWYRERFDIATARAVGSFDLVAELAMPFIRVDGQLLVQKSLGQLDDASRQAARSLPRLGGKVIEVAALDARILGKERVVLVAEKQTKTAPQYPRGWAQMKKDPLG